MDQIWLEQIFKNGTDGVRKFIKPKETSERFSRLCNDIIWWETDFSKTVLQTGFWVPRDGKTPMRLPVLLIPSLEIMRNLLAVWIQPPKFIIYQASSVISQINQIDESQVMDISQNMESTLENFVTKNFPELSEYIIFSFWKQPSDSKIIEKIHEYSLWVESHLDNKTLRSFNASREKHSNAESWHLLYIAANTFYNGWYPETAFPEVWDMQKIIPVWWGSEQRFFQILLQTQSSYREIFPLIAPIASTPSYYHHPDWDSNPGVQRDIQILSQYITN